MLIGIDGNEANIAERVGVNVWALELLGQFKRIKGEKHRFQIYLSRPPLANLPPESPDWQYRVIGPGGFWTRWRLPLDLYLHRPWPDVFLSLSHYAPAYAPMPRIVSIMDLSFLKFPDAFRSLVRWQLTNWTEESIQNAVRVLAISEFTKKEIIRAYGYPEKRITVIYPGIPENTKRFRRLAAGDKQIEIERMKKKYGINRYFFFVGTLQPKKNLSRLVEAFNMIKKDFPDIHLVIAGKMWHQFENHEPRATSHEQVKYLGFVPDADLFPLLAGAECLILPSLYEGFGIPVLEAMALGTPVAASNLTSVPEILGDAGMLFDPTSTEEIARGIREVLSWSPAKRQEQVKKGMIRAEQFSWERGAEKILRIFEEIREKRH